MRQKQFTIEFSNKDTQLSDLIRQIRETPEYREKKRGILQLYTGSLSSEEALPVAKLLTEQLPDISVVAYSVFDSDVFHPTNGFSANLIFTDKADIHVDFVSFEKADRDEILEETAKILSSADDIKYVQMTPSGNLFSHAIYLSCIAERFPDIVFGGAGAGFSIGSDISGHEIDKDTQIRLNHFVSDPEAGFALPGESYVIVDGRVEHEGAAIVSFCGSELFVDARCILGWKPIGKEMEITSARLNCNHIGDTEVFTIDDMPATEIYHKYLGVEPNRYFVSNVCEFPVIIETNGMLQARVPFIYDDDGGLIFNGVLKKGDKIRLSYANPANLISECMEAASEQRSFAPETSFAYVCGNRTNLLKQKAIKELECFKMNSPQMSVSYGHYEIYAKGNRGGVLNSVLVAIALREGSAAESTGEVRDFCDEQIQKPEEANIPLWFRMMKFLEATTGELEKALIAAQDASRAKSNFLSSMSHEIRTPINAILGMNEMILRENHDETIAGYAENIENAGKSLLGLINDILDFSKIEAGRMEIVPVEYELSSVLNDLIILLKTRAEDKGLAFEVLCDKDIPHVLMGDEIRIKQVVTNILTNAVKYTNEGVITMKIGYEKHSDSEIGLAISVEDTGIGMKPEEIGKLYDDYARLDEKRNRTVEGTGLGMGITRQLLELMGSKMEVSSVYGEGSRFEFVLPQKVVSWDGIGDFEEAVRRYARERKAYHRKFRAPDARILVVDDTRINLTVITSLLKQTEVQIETAESGYECLAYTQQTGYDLIFLDHRMPGMDGIATFHRIREQSLSPNTDTPVIALTANAVSGAREEYFREGFTDYLSKPIDPDRLEEMIMRYLPADKVMEENESDEGSATVNTAWEDDNDLPSGLSKLNYIDTEEGMLYCGGKEGYLQALSIFAESAADNAANIKELFDGKHWEDYTTKVHALKSSARVIGAGKLSEAARDLEAAGNEGDIDRITRDTPALLEGYVSIGKDLLDVLGLDKEDSDLPEISLEELEESYEAIREFAQGYDMDSIGFVLQILKKYSIPESAGERHKKLMESIKAADWDRIKGILA